MQWIKITTFIVLFVSELHAITLEDSIFNAYKNSNEIAIQQMNIDISKAEITHSLQKFLPSAKYSLQRGTGYVSGLSAAGFGSDHAYNIKNDTFSITSDLSLHQIIAIQIQSFQNLRSSKAKYSAFLNSFTVDIVQNHLDIIIANESLNLMKIMEKDIGIDKYNSQIKSITESINHIENIGVESKYDDITSRVIQSEMAFEILKDRYKTITKNDAKNLELPNKFKLPAINFEEYLEMTLRENKDLEDMKAQMIIVNSVNIASYLDLFMPKISVSYVDSKSIIAFLPGSPLIRTKATTTSLDFALYENGDKLNNTIQASIQKRILERKKLILEDSLKLSAKTYWSNHHSFLLLEKSKKKALEISNIKLAVALEKFSKKSISFSELVKMRVDFYNAKIDYLRVYREFVLNYYKILSLV